MTTQIDLLAKAIPISILRSEIAKIDTDFKAKSKQDFIAKLRQENNKLLEELAVYYASIRENKLFVCKIKQKHKPEPADIGKAVAKIRALKYNDGQGNIYELRDVTHRPSEGLIFFKVVVHSDVKHFYKEKPEMNGDYNLLYRDKNATLCFLHLSPWCLEIRTGRRRKAELTLVLLNKKLFEEETASEIYLLSDEEKRKLAGGDGLRFKEAVIEGLSLTGCSEITIKGEDVDSTLKYFKDRGTDLVRLAQTISKKKEETANQQFRFYDDGKITIKKRMSDQFTILAGVVFSNEK